MTTPSGMRIGDADREAAAASLREHFALGRLALEEFQQRLDAVFAAKTDRQLAAISRDLPRATTSPAPWPQARPTMRSALAGRKRSNGYGQYSGRGGRYRPWPALNFGLLLVAIVLIVALARPFDWLSDFVPRPLIILALVLLFIFRMVRKIARGPGRIGRGGRCRPF